MFNLIINLIIRVSDSEDSAKSILSPGRGPSEARPLGPGQGRQMLLLPPAPRPAALLELLWRRRRAQAASLGPSHGSGGGQLSVAQQLNGGGVARNSSLARARHGDPP